MSKLHYAASIEDIQAALALQDPKSFARGTLTEGDIITQTVDGRDLNAVWNEFQQTLLAWNADRSALINALTFNVNQIVEDVPQIAKDDFEEASEFGEPKGLRGGGYFSMAYGFKWYDIAVRYTWKYLADVTAGQLESQHSQVLEADNRLQFQLVMKQLFNPTTRIIDVRGQTYNVYPFYNGDTMVPPDFKHWTHTSGHNHFLTSGAVTVDSGDLDDLELHLRHHGYGRKNGAGATMILMVSQQEFDVIRKFRIATGASYDFIPVASAPPFILPNPTIPNIQGTPPAQVNGLDVSGQYGSWLVVQEDYIPPGYVFAFATGGPNNASNPVGIREHQNPALRGLRLIKGRDNDYPLVDSFYGRAMGTGVRHRGAGAVMQITTAGSYTVPTVYA